MSLAVGGGSRRDRSRSRGRDEPPRDAPSYADVREPSYVYPEDDLDDRYKSSRRHEPTKGGGLPYPAEYQVDDIIPGGRSLYSYDDDTRPIYRTASPSDDNRYRNSQNKDKPKPSSQLPGAFPEDKPSKQDEADSRRAHYIDPRDSRESVHNSRRDGDEKGLVRYAEPSRDDYDYDRERGSHSDADEKLKYLPQKYSRRYEDNEDDKYSSRDKDKKKDRRARKERDEEDLAYGRPPGPPPRSTRPESPITYGSYIPSSSGHKPTSQHDWDDAGERRSPKYADYDDDYERRESKYDREEVDRRSSKYDRQESDKKSSKYDVEDVERRSSKYDRPESDKKSSKYDIEDIEKRSSKYDRQEIDKKSSKYDIEDVEKRSSKYDKPEYEKKSSKYEVEDVEKRSSKYDRQEVDKKSSKYDVEDVDRWPSKYDREDSGKRSSKYDREESDKLYSPQYDKEDKYSSKYDKDDKHSSKYDKDDKRSSKYDKEDKHSSKYDKDDKQASKYDKEDKRSSKYDRDDADKRSSKHDARDKYDDRDGDYEHGSKKSHRDPYRDDPRSSAPTILTAEPGSGRDRDRRRDKSPAPATLTPAEPGKSRRDKSPGPSVLTVEPGKRDRASSRDRRGDRDRSPQPPVARLSSLSVSGGRPSNLSLAAAPGSPLLESYHGTYQDCSPMPSPLLLASANPKDDPRIMDLSPLNSDVEGDSKKISRRARFHDPEDISTQLHRVLQGHRLPVNVEPLVAILPSLTHEQVMELRIQYKRVAKTDGGQGINIAKHIKSRLKDEDPNLLKACYTVALGKWESEGYWASFWYQGDKNRRELLMEALMGRTNDEISMIKAAFTDKKYDNSLTKCMKLELKEDKFKKAVLLVLEERRMEDYDEYGRRIPIDYDLVDRDVDDLRKSVKATKGGESSMISIILQRSDDHLRAVLKEYEHHYRANFAREALKKSNNLVGELIMHVLNGVINRPVRDAILLNHALTASRKDSLRRELLISRLVRYHWDAVHMQMVKRAYREKYGKDLQEAVREATSGQWGLFCSELCIARMPNDVRKLY